MTPCSLELNVDLRCSQVRSGALYVLAVFDLIVSLLPTSMMRPAAWLSGVQGDRAKALRMLGECWQEDGLLAPFAALGLCVYHADLKTFLGVTSRHPLPYTMCPHTSSILALLHHLLACILRGEAQTVEDFALCEEIIQ